MSWEQSETQKVGEDEQRGHRAGEAGFGGEFTGARQCTGRRGARGSGEEPAHRGLGANQVFHKRVVLE